MYSKVKILGHPLHAMLVAFPVTFYTSSFLSYIVYNYNASPFWFHVALATNIAGVITAAVAAVPGFIDWAFGIPKNTEAKKTGLVHMILNVTALVLFAVSAFVNYPKWDEATPYLGATVLLTGLGFVATFLAGFYGWTLVQKYHIGVDLTAAQQVIEPEVKHGVFSPDPLSKTFT